MASGFLIYYSINALFATHLRKDLDLSRHWWRRRSTGQVVEMGLEVEI